MKYGMKKTFCDIYWNKKLDDNNKEEFVEYLRKNWTFDEIQLNMGCKALTVAKRQEILNKHKNKNRT